MAKRNSEKEVVESKIGVIPALPLRSENLTKEHKTSFILDYTQLIFKPKLKAVYDQIPSPIPSKKALWKAIKKVTKRFQKNDPVLRLISTKVHKSNYFVGVCQGGFNVRGSLEGALGRLEMYSSSAHCNMDHQRLRAFSSGMTQDLGIDRTKRLEAEYKEQFPVILDAEGKELPGEFVWCPYGFSEKLHSDTFINYKKVQDPDTYEITRIPFLREQFEGIVDLEDVIALSEAEQIQKTDTKAIDDEIIVIRNFMNELWYGLNPVRTTKQLQQRWPEIFDDFCSITGLGQCDGKYLLPVQSINTAQDLIRDFHKTLNR